MANANSDGNDIPSEAAADDSSLEYFKKDEGVVLVSPPSSPAPRLATGVPSPQPEQGRGCRSSSPTERITQTQIPSFRSSFKMNSVGSDPGISSPLTRIPRFQTTDGLVCRQDDLSASEKRDENVTEETNVMLDRTSVFERGREGHAIHPRIKRRSTFSSAEESGAFSMLVADGTTDKTEDMLVAKGESSRKPRPTSSLMRSLSVPTISTRKEGLAGDPWFLAAPGTLDGKGSGGRMGIHEVLDYQNLQMQLQANADVCSNTSRHGGEESVNPETVESGNSRWKEEDIEHSNTLSLKSNYAEKSTIAPCHRCSVPFFVVLALIFSLLTSCSCILIHFMSESTLRDSQSLMFSVSLDNIHTVARDLHSELAEKIGLKAQTMFSRPEQTFKRYVSAVRDGIYDPVRDRYSLVHEMLRADEITSYASLAFVNGYYLSNGHFTISIADALEEDAPTVEHYGAISRRMEWLQLYNQPIYRCQGGATQMRSGYRGNWTEITDPERGYVLSTNIHWTQALVEADGSLPKEGLVESPLECSGDNGNILPTMEYRKKYSGWFQDFDPASEGEIDAAVGKGVGQAAFAFSELWGVDEPPGHAGENQTLETYDFKTPIWPDDNVDGNHSFVTFQDSGGWPLTGLTNQGVTNIMYSMLFDTRKRQWYQRAEELYKQFPVPPRGKSAYHSPIVSWFPLYVWQNEIPDLAVGMTSPLYGPGDAFVGVMTLDISVRAISNFLAEQKYGKVGVSFAVRTEKYVHSHGGVGLDEYRNMSYNNHVGALLGVSKGSDFGKVCGNDYTNNSQNDRHGPHYKLNETEWVRVASGERHDYNTLEEMVLPINTYNAGGWECRSKIDGKVVQPTNRALPAQNHENALIAGSAKYIKQKMGGFDGLVAQSSSGRDTITVDDGAVTHSLLLHWNHVTGLEFPGFRPLIVVVVPEKDYLSSVRKANAEANLKIKESQQKSTVVIVVSIVFTTVLSILTALLVTMPLNRLKAEFARLARLEINTFYDGSHKLNSEEKSSFIREIGSIQTSFRSMEMGLASFSKFVPFSVVKRIVGGDMSASRLGVQKREVTVMFATIANFAALVEKCSLDVVMQVLEEYLTAMISVIEAKGGTVGDFLGDCIMSFWGSPQSQPDHAQLAVDAMFAMEEKIMVWNEIWAKRGIDAIAVQIGINSGEALSGNIGSPVKMKFGVVGEAVNLASRVENLNKFYGTSHLITNSTYEAVRGLTICRPIDKIAIKGEQHATCRPIDNLGVKDQQPATLIYEPLARSDEPNAKELQQIADKTAKMLSLYFRQLFSDVISRAEQHLSVYPDDKPILNLLEQSKQYIYDSPGLDWDGVSHMEEKSPFGPSYCNRFLHLDISLDEKERPKTQTSSAQIHSTENLTLQSDK